MPGIQTRGRNRITTNKIEQDKKTVEVYKSGQSTPEHHTNAVAVYQPLPSSSKLEQSTQNQIQSTESNIEQAVRAKKVKHMVKPRTSDDPASKIMLGMSNTIQDYGGIVQGGYEDKSILNQAIGHAFEGNWDKAGQVIQNNPYRFAGNLAVEAGSFLVPVGGILKVAKVAKATQKAKYAVMKKIDESETSIESSLSTVKLKRIFVPSLNVSSSYTLSYSSEIFHYGNVMSSSMGCLSDLGPGRGS